MSQEATEDFTPERDRVADAGAEVPVIDISPFRTVTKPLVARWWKP